jgi:class 3 adenylate cyclase
MVVERQNRVDRRLAAILAADVAGYSRLMGLDEVGTAQVPTFTDLGSGVSKTLIVQ